MAQFAALALTAFLVLAGCSVEAREAWAQSGLGTAILVGAFVLLALLIRKWQRRKSRDRRGGCGGCGSGGIDCGGCGGGCGGG